MRVSVTEYYAPGTIHTISLSTRSSGVVRCIQASHSGLNFFLRIDPILFTYSMFGPETEIDLVFVAPRSVYCLWANPDSSLILSVGRRSNLRVFGFMFVCTSAHAFVLFLTSSYVQER